MTHQPSRSLTKRAAPRSKIAIIALALNEAHNLPDLKATLDSERQRAEANVEVISVLVDAGSTDETVHVAQALEFDVIIELPGSTIPEARNVGAEATDAPWLAFIDADCRPQLGWLDSAVAVLSLDELSIGGWPTVCPDDMTWVQRAWQAHWNTKLEIKQLDADGYLRHAETHRLLTTRNLVLTREVYDQLDGFDTALPTGEDSDFAYRAHAAGLSLVGAPRLVVTHLGEPATLAEFFRQQMWHANRASYSEDDRVTEQLGRNPQLFTTAFLLAAALGILVVIAATAIREWAFLPLAILPVLAVLAIPALRTSWRSRAVHLLPGLVVLYGAYGLARSIDVFGGARRVQRWRVSSLP